MLNFIKYLKEYNLGSENWTPQFNSAQMRKAWLNATPGKISELVTILITLLPELDKEYQEMFTEWLQVANKDYSSTYDKFDENPCINITSNLTTYYLGKGILSLKTGIDEYKKEESHSLQKYLIKLKEGAPVTIRVYKNDKGKIIYYNKTDDKTVQFLKYINFTTFLLNSKEEILVDLGKKLEEILENKNTDFKNLIDSIEAKIKESKKKQLDEIIDKTVTAAYTRGRNNRIANLESAIKNTKDNITRILETYTSNIKMLDDNLDKLDILKTEDSPNNAYARYIRKLQEMSNGKVYKAPGFNTLYMFIETPLIYTNNDRIGESINYIKREKERILERLEEGSGIRITSTIDKVLSDLLEKKEITEAFEDKGRFLDAFIEVMSEIFVKQDILLHMHSLIYWNDESYNNFMMPIGVKASELERYHVQANRELVKNASKYIWNSHLFSHNCWDRTKTEIIKAIKNDNPEDAAQYTLTALQQLTYTDAGSSGTFRMLTGNYSSFREYMSEDLSNKTLTELKAYEKIGSKERATLFELLKEAYEKKEDKKEEEEVTDFYTTEEVSAWLEENHTIITEDTAIVACEPKETTNFMLNGVEHVWIPSGDFLTLEKYTEYLDKFKGITISPPSHKGETR